MISACSFLRFTVVLLLISQAVTYSPCRDKQRLTNHLRLLNIINDETVVGCQQLKEGKIFVDVKRGNTMTRIKLATQGDMTVLSKKIIVQPSTLRITPMANLRKTKRLDVGKRQWLQQFSLEAVKLIAGRRFKGELTDGVTVVSVELLKIGDLYRVIGQVHPVTSN